MEEYIWTLDEKELNAFKKHKDATMWSRIGGMWWYNTMEEGGIILDEHSPTSPTLTGTPLGVIVL